MNKPKPNKNKVIVTAPARDLGPTTEEMNQVVSLYGKGEHLEMEKLTREMTRKWPNHVFGWKALGVSLKMQKKDAEAMPALRKSVELDPLDSDVHNNLASALREAGDIKTAQLHFETAIKLKPEYPEALSGLGMTLRAQGKVDEAIEYYKKSIAINPKFPEGYNNLGNAYREKRQFQEAIHYYTKAMECRPNYADAMNGMGNVMVGLANYPAAIEYYRQAIATQPVFPEAFNGLANALKASGRIEEAKEKYLQSIALRPSYHDPYHNLANLYKDLNQTDNAITYYRKAIEAKPDYYSAAAGLGMALLHKGEYLDGWKYYENRWLGFEQAIEGLLKAPVTSLPQWRGEEIKPGDAILVFCEQGLGDSLQFVRYVPLLAKRFRQVTAIFPSLLINIFNGSMHAENLEITDRIPSDHSRWQWHCSTLSLPLAFGTTIDSVPNEVPYLRPPINRVDYWKEKLDTATGNHKPRIGLVWAGGNLLKDDSKRSIPPHLMLSLINNPAYTWVSLQKASVNTKKLSKAQAPDLLDWMDEIQDFADTAALIENLDLVISVDTSVAHLAGAQAKTTWMLNRNGGDWRWIVNREDSPWYPTMRIFTQKVSGDWEAVIKEVGLALEEKFGTPALTVTDTSILPEPTNAIPDNTELQHLLNLFCSGAIEEHQNQCRIMQAKYPNPEKGFVRSYTEVLNGFAASLSQAKNSLEASRYFECSLSLNPDQPAALYLLGLIYYNQKNLESAISRFRQAVQLDNQHYAAHMGLALALLSKGEWTEGWKEYEYRSLGSDVAATGNANKPATTLPVWHGQSVGPEDSLLVFREQGFGDAIQFIRYIALAASRFRLVTVVCLPSLLQLFKHSLSTIKNIEVISSTPKDQSNWQWHCMMLSLPLAFGTTVDDLPQHVPYLYNPEELLGTWANRCKQIETAKLKVGLAWASNRENTTLTSRSMPFKELAPLFEIEGITWVSLQKEHQETLPDSLHNWMSEVKDFADTAALIEQLDMVISVDTSVAHLAGALGKPVWLMNRYESDWRWMMNREDSPWYPSMRIFTQSKAGQWQSVIAEIRKALQETLFKPSEETTEVHHTPDMQNVLQQLLSAFNLQPVQDYQKTVTEAVRHHQKNGQEIIPAYVDLLNHFGYQFFKIDSLAEARRCFAEVVRLDPNNVYALHHLSIVLFDIDEIDECVQILRHAVTLPNSKLDYTTSVFSMALLAQGNFEEGLPLLEYRWTGSDQAAIGKKVKPKLPMPEWLGQQTADQDTLVIYFEQGAGDQIQFIRYIRELGSRFKSITVCGNPAVLSLFRYSYSDLTNVDFMPDFPANVSSYTWNTALMSIPLALHLKPANINGEAYLKVPPDRLLKWEKQFNQILQTKSRKLKIGIAWAGSKGLGADRRRSIPSEMLLPLLKTQEFTWVSLQKADTEEKLPDASCKEHLLDWMDKVEDFADTAAIIQQLDMVISVDTSIAHLAGALGKPVWMLNRIGGDWRWKLQKNSSPWYASMRIFTQHRFGDWHDVIAEVAQELASLAQSKVVMQEELVSQQCDPEDLQMLLNAFTQESVESYRSKLDATIAKYKEKDVDFVTMYVTFINNFAYQFMQHRVLNESRKCFQEAVRIAPQDFYATYHLGIVLGNLNEFEESERLIRRALEIDIQPFAQYALSLALLAQEKFDEGWPLFEYRWTGSDQSAQGKNKKSDLPLPHWTGEPVGTKDSLLLYMEEGNGDRIQFIRFLPRLASIFHTIYLFGDINTLPLFTHSYAHLKNVKFIEEKRTDIKEPVLWQCAIMSLAFALKLQPEEVSGESYLKTPPEYSDKWRKKMAAVIPADTRLKIGIAWTGSSGLGADNLRSLLPEHVLNLIQRKDVIWVNLQKADKDAKKLDMSLQPHLIDLMADVKDFADTAAIIEQLDLVISVDTSVAHLAGAMGKPVWMLNRFSGDWRWLVQKDTSKWYSSMRIFNQKSPGDWKQVIEKVNAEITNLIAQAQKPPPLKDHEAKGVVMSVDSVANNEKQYTNLSAEEQEVLPLIQAFNRCDLVQLEKTATALENNGKLKKLIAYMLGIGMRLQHKKVGASLPIDLSADDIAGLPHLSNELKIITESMKQFDKVPNGPESYPIALHKMAATLIVHGQMQIAIPYYQRAIARKPNFIEAITNLGTCYLKTSQFNEAIHCYEQALKLKSDYIDATNGLAVTYKTMGDFDKAVVLFKKALTKTPKHAELLNNLAATLLDMRDAEQAIPLFRQSIKVDPDYQAAYMGLALSLLMTGKWEEGWQHYEHRWSGSNFALQGKLNKIKAKSPQWKGEAIPADATLLVFTEQGLGDNFQFIRYIKLAATRFAKVAVLCPGTLINIFRGSLSKVDNVTVTTEITDTNNAWQYHCYIMSLPLAFKTTLENIPNQVPYLSAPHNRVSYWSSRVNFAANGRPKVGLVWAGGAKLRDDSKRSIMVNQLLPLLGIERICWVSLQKSDRREKLSSPECAKHMLDWMDEIQDFADTAALIETLDLVISVDTSIAHLAGALGKPVWLFNRYSGDWRWMINREDSPWYPTMRIFNQTKVDLWDDVIARMFDALQFWVKEMSTGLPTIAINASIATEGDLASQTASIMQAFESKDWRALEQTSRALTVQFPHHGFGYKSLGVALKMLKRDDEALPVLYKAVECLPDDAIVLNNYANALNQAGKLDEAATYYEKALKLTPNLEEAQENLAIILINMTVNLNSADKLEEALELCKKALSIKPNSTVALFNQGVLLKDLNRNEEAISSYQKAIDLDPTYLDPQYNISLSQLALGNFEQGWANYELRFKREEKKPLAPTPYPLWLGEMPITGKKLLIQTEQGFGDTIHIARYLTQLEEAGVECYMQVSSSLVNLIRRSFPKSKVIDASLCPQELDYRIPLMSLPLAMKTFSVADIRSYPSYLVADKLKVEVWKEKLGLKSKKSIGLIWRGSPTHKNDKNRSTSVKNMLQFVTKNPSIQFVSLQKHLTPEERSALETQKNMRILDTELNDFDDTAAVICNLDAVITIDSSVAHLTAALGKEVWVMLAFRPDWRWLLNREDSPWYPTMRLFRQKKRSDWASVISVINKKLKKLSSH